MLDSARIIEALDTPRILVLGDLILDRYAWGAAERVSPEAPVLVLRAEHDEVRLGGASSVALLLAALEAKVELAGVIGDDPSGRTLARLVDVAHIDRSLVLPDAERETTVKERIVGRTAGRQPHQIVRLDRETRRPISRVLEQQLIDGIRQRLRDYQVLCIADYDKGVCTPRLLQSVLRAAAEQGVPTIVDPARVADYLRYRRATLVKPNRVEAELASGQPVDSAKAAITAADMIARRFRLAAVLVTLDADGMVLVTKDEGSQHFATRPRQVCDVTGAGDMTLAMLGLCAASGIAWPEAAWLANVAAGLQVERFGIAPISRAELAAALVDGLPSPFRRAARDDSPLRGGRGEGALNCSLPGHCSRELATGQDSHEFCYDALSRPPLDGGAFMSLTNLLSQLASHRCAGRSIVFTNGCFDLFHIGHLLLLQEAATLGDVLVVGLNSDASVRQLKGLTRPVIAENDRAAMIAAFSFVDYVVIFDDPTPHRLLEAIPPDVLVKGGTYARDEVVGHEIVEAYGGRIHVAGRVDGVSTSAIVERLARSYARVEESEVRSRGQVTGDR